MNVKTSSSHAAFPVLLVIAESLSIQFGSALAKTVIPITGPIGATALRVGFSLLLILILFRPNIKSAIPYLHQLLPYGIFMGLMKLLFFVSLAYIPLGIATTLLFTGPLGLTLIQARGKMLLIALIAIAGVLLTVFGEGNIQNSTSLIGNLCALGAGAAWAGYILSASKLSPELKDTSKLAIGMYIASIMIVPLGIGSHQLDHLTPHLLLLGLGYAALSSALPYLIDLWVLSRISTLSYGLLLTLEPAIAAGIGFLLLGEKIGLLSFFGILAIIIATAGEVILRKQQGHLSDAQ